MRGMKKIVITKATGLCCVLLIVMSLVSASRSQSVNKVDDFTVTLVTETAGPIEGEKVTKKEPKIQVQVTREFGILSMRAMGSTGIKYTNVLAGIKIKDKWYTVDKDGGIVETKIQDEITAFDAIVSSGEVSCISNYSSRTVKEYDPTLKKGKTTYRPIAASTLIDRAIPLNKENDFRFKLGAIGDCVERVGGSGDVIVAVRLFDTKTVEINKKTEIITNEEGFSFVWTPEYFKGEQTLLAKVSTNASASYQDKALSIMIAMWTDIEAGTSGNLGNIINASVTAEDVKPYKLALTYSLVNDLMPLYSASDATVQIDKEQVLLSDFPILKKLDDATIFNALYEAKADPYLRAYIYSCYSYEKSMYSKKVFKSEKENFNIDNNYTEFRSVSSSEGEEIAKAALQFYCWGVEYTPGPVKSSLPNVTNIFNNNKELIEKWIGRQGDLDKAFTDASNMGSLKVKSADGNETDISVQIPFKAADGNKYEAGNPLPYIKGGVDSARVFSYKMYQQYIAGLLTAPGIDYKSTRAFTEDKGIKVKDPDANTIDELASRWYTDILTDGKWLWNRNREDGVSDKDNKKTYKPFVPYKPESKDIYPIEKMAGVDATGLLVGSLAMTSIRDKVLALGDIKPAGNLAKYYSMTSQVPGLYSDGTPLFNIPKDFSSISSGDYRITRADFEKISCLVPSLNEVQCGDIIVHMGSSEEMFGIKVKDSDYLHIGIVAYNSVNRETASKIENATKRREEYEKGIYLVHTSEQYERIRLDTILSSGFGSQYQIRRLLIEGKSTSTIARAESPSWDVVDDEIQSMNIRLFDKGDVGTSDESLTERWIPNTGEYKEFQIDIALLNAAGLSCNPNDIYGIKIEPVIDRSLSTATAEQKNTEVRGNIYKNMGDGFELVVRSDSADGNFDTEKAIVVAKFNRNEEGGYLLKNDVNCLLDNNGYLANTEWKWFFSYNNRVKRSSLQLQKDGKTYSHFGIRPYANNIKPGDDIQISISIYRNSDAEKSTTCTGVSDEKYYLAVYDKKMIWRANLYIDDKKSDWNNQKEHTWNAPPAKGAVVKGDSNPAWGRSNYNIASSWDGSWGYNEWNRYWKGDTIEDRNGDGKEDRKDIIELIDELPSGDGKQVIELPSFTPIRRVDERRSANVIRDRVAYSYPYSLNQDAHHDGPFDFKKKMLNEICAIRQYSSIYWPNGIGPAVATAGCGEIKANYTKSNLMNWSFTTAPGGIWGRNMSI